MQRKVKYFIIVFKINVMMDLKFSKGYYQKKKGPGGPDPEHILCLVRIPQKYFYFNFRMDLGRVLSDVLLDLNSAFERQWTSR